MRALAIYTLAIAVAQAAEVSPRAVTPYTAESHPRIALKWGVEALADINRLRFASARKVAASRECDRVASAELFDLRSESPSLWTVSVACENGRRFDLRQSDLSYR